MVSYFKTPVYRSEQHRRNVAALPCARCGVEQRSQAAHVGGLAEGKGGALKVGDDRTIPLCGPQFSDPGCHYLFDNHLLEFADRATSDAAGERMLLETLLKLVRNGSLKPVKG